MIPKLLITQHTFLTLRLPPFLHTTYRQRRSKVKISKVSLIGKIFGKEVMWEMPRWLWCIWRKCRPKFWSIEQLLAAASLDHSLGVTVAYRQDFSSLFRGSGYFAWYYSKEYRTLLFATDFHIRHTSKTRMKFDSQVCSKVCVYAHRRYSRLHSMAFAHWAIMGSKFIACSNVSASTFAKCYSMVTTTDAGNTLEKWLVWHFLGVHWQYLTIGIKGMKTYTIKAIYNLQQIIS